MHCTEPAAPTMTCGPGRPRISTALMQCMRGHAPSQPLLHPCKAPTRLSSRACSVFQQCPAGRPGCATLTFRRGPTMQVSRQPRGAFHHTWEGNAEAWAMGIPRHSTGSTHLAGSRPGSPAGPSASQESPASTNCQVQVFGTPQYPPCKEPTRLSSRAFCVSGVPSL